MRKSEQICARVTPEVLAGLRAAADKQSVLLSEFVRRALAEKVNELTTPKAINDPSLGDYVGDSGFRYSYR
jgi:hypothetical protein